MNSVLNEQEHARIIHDLAHICETAGVQPRFMHASMKDFCLPAEVQWVQKFNQHRREGCPGLVMDGGDKPDTRCQSIAAALIRNFIDARVIPMNRLLEMTEARDSETPNPTVLLIPNLCVTLVGKAIPSWKIQQIYDVLMFRAVQSKPTVVYVEMMESVVKAFGKPFADFLSGFKVVKGGK